MGINELTLRKDQGMKFSQIKRIKAQFGTDWPEIVNEMEKEVDDFEVGIYRFIHEDSIDEILVGELEEDTYILGCFSAYALAKATDWPIALIEAAQKSEQYAVIGGVMTNEQVRKLAEIYVDSDGYGHHFASYDGEEIETECGYYAFRIN